MDVQDTRQLELEGRLRNYDITLLSNIIETLDLTPPTTVSQLGNLRVIRNYMESSTDTDERGNCLDALCLPELESDENTTVPKPDDVDERSPVLKPLQNNP